MKLLQFNSDWYYSQNFLSDIQNTLEEAAGNFEFGKPKDAERLVCSLLRDIEKVWKQAEKRKRFIHISFDPNYTEP